ncbi:hypothetical protein OVA24_10085 [Luteolibacter sp. SL250]|uniref:hypothetical protein n=1 Tax=Luteolibacter sp. SL250 TaxID=2995170 RepID=UPI00226D503E|nr:hypothetical protein [Luteolibacter sp. SL250]WAC21733.1 hypothetical protein OVA24_10085 [Luteolibacter sp. SL250]
MKLFANFLVVGGAGVFGYFAEPSLRLELTGLSPTAPPPPQQPGNQEEVYLSRVDPRVYAPEQLPKEVTLKKEAELTDSSSGLKIPVPTGTKLKLLRLGQGTLIVGTGSPNIEGEVEIQNTDVREQLIGVAPTAPSPVAAQAQTMDGQPADGQSTAPQDGMAKNESSGNMAGGTPDNTETASNDAKNDAPTDGTNPALKPGDAPAEPTGEFVSMSADEIVQTMQDSLKGATIKDIKFDQVSEWAGGEPEEVDGKKFNTGTISYKAQTILGLKSRKAKAYIVGGKVVRWINPTSGTEIQ